MILTQNSKSIFTKQVSELSFLLSTAYRSQQEHTGPSVSSASPGWNRNTLETPPRVLHKYSHYIQFRKLIFGDVIVFSVLDNSIQTKLSTSYFTSQAYHGWPAGTGTHWKLSHRSVIATIIIFHHKHFYFLVVL